MEVIGVEEEFEEEEEVEVEVEVEEEGDSEFDGKYFKTSIKPATAYLLCLPPFLSFFLSDIICIREPSVTVASRWMGTNERTPGFNPFREDITQVR